MINCLRLIMHIFWVKLEWAKRVDVRMQRRAFGNGCHGGGGGEGGIAFYILGMR